MRSSITGARQRQPRSLAALLGLLAALATVSPSLAQTEAEALRALATAPDYRLRVAAALSLGAAKSPSARLALERALGDSEPAVRAAASAALGAQGNPAALVALRAALAKETMVSVRAQLESTIARLGGATAPVKARYLVALGKIENKSGAGPIEVVSAFRSQTRARLARIPGVELVAEGADVSAQGKARSLPVFTVDAALMALAKAQGPTSVSYSARVEYVIRKLPGQTLEGTMRGSAKALADHTEIHGDGHLLQLQIDAVSGAIDSALKGAAPALEAAAN